LPIMLLRSYLSTGAASDPKMDDCRFDESKTVSKECSNKHATSTHQGLSTIFNKTGWRRRGGAVAGVLLYMWLVVALPIQDTRRATFNVTDELRLRQSGLSASASERKRMSSRQYTDGGSKKPKLSPAPSEAPRATKLRNIVRTQAADVPRCCEHRRSCGV
jgi:hypothetical protein